MTLKGHLWRIGRVCWYALATCIVLLALLVSAVRTLLPKLDSIRDDLVAQIQQRTQLEMSFAELGASWEPKGPQLVIRGFKLPPQGDLNLTVDVEEAVAQLDFWRSVVDQYPRFEDVTFNGVEVHVLGPLGAQNNNADSNRGGGLEAFKSTFLHGLKQLELNEASIYFHQLNEQPEPVHIASLQWVNQGRRHLGQGLLYLDQAQKEDELLTLSVEMSSDNDHIFGRTYVHADQLDIGDWLARQFGDGSRQFKGTLDLKAWSSFDDAGLRTVQVEFGHSEFSWQTPQSQRMTLESGSLSWSPRVDGGQLVSHDLKLFSNGEPWDDTRLALRKQGNGFNLWLEQLSLDKLKPLLGLVPSLDDDTLVQLLEVNGRGHLTDLKLQQTQQNWLASVSFSDLGWDMSGDLPGLTGLNGEFRWHQDHGRLHIDRKPLRFYWPWQFRETLQLEQFGADIDLRLDDGIVLTSDNLTLAGDIIDADLQWALGLPSEGPVRLQLYGDASLKQADKAGLLFPRQAMGIGLSNYLERSLQGGHADNVQLLWHGDLNQYPYLANEGVFQAGFTLEQGQFQFLESWPAVTDLSLRALFENQRMDLWLDRGNLDSVPVSNAQVFIPTLNRDATLGVVAKLGADAQAATELMLQSSLKDSVGSTLEQVQITGPVDVELDLMFPLGEGVADESPSVLGAVNFKDNPVFLKTLGVELTDLNGLLTFDSARIEAPMLSATLFNQFTDLSINGDQQPEGYQVDLTLGGHWSTEHFTPEHNFPLFAYLDGAADWQGSVNLNFAPDNQYQFAAKVNTDLVGLHIDLPKPVGKTAQARRRTQLEINGDQDGAELVATQGGRLGYRAEFDFSQGEFDWTRYQLALGKRPNLIGVDSGSIDLAMSEAVLTDWLPLITRFIDSGSESSGSSVVPPLTQVKGSLSRLDIYDLLFDQTFLNGYPVEGGWQFDVESDQAQGALTIHSDWENQGIGIQADYLSLQWLEKDSGEQERAGAQLIEAMPPLSAKVKNFFIQEYDLGELNLALQQTPEGYRLQTFDLTKGVHQFKSSGLWYPKGEGTQFDMKGQFTSDDFGALEQVIDRPIGLKESPLETHFDVSWQNAPWAYESKSLNGELQFEFGKGHLSEVSDKGVRLLSIFSFDSLLRKLSLDFTDVFGQGFYYQEFSGDVRFNDGIATTDNTRLEGDAGVMKISGSSNLVSRQLDYDISFSPALTASVPAVALLSGASLTVGVGAFAVSKILEPVIEVITQLNFRLTGTFDEPILEELERDKKEIRIEEEAASDVQPQPEQKPIPGSDTSSVNGTPYEPELPEPLPDSVPTTGESATESPAMEVLPEPLPDTQGQSVGQ